MSASVSGAAHAPPGSVAHGGGTQAPDALSCAAFLSSSLDKLYAASSWRDGDLREALNATKRSLAEHVAKTGGITEENGDMYFRPFQMACDNRNSKVRAMALDMIEKMIAYGHLQGRLRVWQGSVERYLIDIVIETICASRDDQAEGVQLQVIKALLTAITCPTCTVREQTLLLAVRAVYHIYLVSRNAVNKNTAKATLRQMLNYVSDRMEKFAQRRRLAPAPGSSASGATTGAAATASSGSGAGEGQDSAASDAAEGVDTSDQPAFGAAAEVAALEAAAAVAAEVEAAEAAEAERTGAPHKEQQHAVLNPYTAGTTAAAAPAVEEAEPEAEAGAAADAALQTAFGGNMYPAVAAHLGFTLADSVAVAAAAPAPAPDTHDQAEASTQAAATSAAAPVPGAGVGMPPRAASDAGSSATGAAAGFLPGAFHPASTSPDAADLGGFASPYHRDAFLLFRAVCRLSMKGDEDPLLPTGARHLPGAGPQPVAARRNSGVRAGDAHHASSLASSTASVLTDEALLNDPVALSSKLLALDLVLSMLEGAGAAFRSDPKFIGAIKQYLCVGLLKNILSSIPAVSSSSLKVFLALMRGFKQHIAAEIEVFISAVFLRLLTSAHSSFEQKMAVLAAFRSITTDPAAMLEIFLNYDCVDGRQNLFESSVNVLASIAQGRASAEFNASQKTVAETVAIRSAALGALASIVQSMTVVVDAAVGARGVSPSAIAGAPESSAPAAGATPTGAASGSAEAGEAREEEEGAQAEGAALPSGGSGPLGGKRDAAPSPSLSSPSAAPTGGSGVGGLPPSAGAGHAHSASRSAALAKSYDEQKKRRAMVETAVLKFVAKPRAGVEYMQQVGLCGSSAASVAALLHELKNSLDKTAIGDYMGEDKPFCIQVLHAYIDQLDFVGLSFDGAIRHALSGFRLPGEAQKIDRIMEKFAERYCACNPGVFPSADTAFILAYSVIMLQTDAHNPNIKPEKKMTKAGFISNNRGIANGADLPADFLGAIYDSIVRTPISLKEDEDRRAKSTVVADEKQRRAMQEAERMELVKAGQAAMSTARRAGSAPLAALDAPTSGGAPGSGEGGSGGGAAGAGSSGSAGGGARASSYYTINDVSLSDHVQPMLEIAWAPFLAAFSVVLETTPDEDGRTVNACLVGFAQAIHMTGWLRMDTPRDAFVTSLCKFTLLDSAATGIREMRGKNIAATRAMLNISLQEGDRLGAAWGPLLMCVSQLSRLIMLASGAKDDDAFFEAPPAQARAPAVRTARASSGAGSHERARLEAERIHRTHERDAVVERHNAAALAANFAENDITRVYTQSTALSADAIAHFVAALAAVSLQELAAVTTPPASLLHALQPGSAPVAAPAPQSAPPTTPPQGAPRSSTSAGVVVHVAPATFTAHPPPPPRVFSLQKVVEVADFNMNTRPRMTWARIWDTLSDYFAAVCCSNNVQIAMYAIDSLKQLSVKFLTKSELRSFHFQTKFLQPFLTLMELTQQNKSRVAAQRPPHRGAGGSGGLRGAPALTPSGEIRELILHVCANLIRARHAQIRSGWRTFMGVYAAAAADEDELLVSLAFSTVHEVLTSHIDAVASSGAFGDAVKCMIAFGSNAHALFAMRAIDHCATLGAQLARGRVPLTEDAVDEYTQYTRGTTLDVGPAGAPGEEAPAPRAPPHLATEASEEAAAATAAAADAGAGSTTSGGGGSSSGGGAPEEWYDLDGAEHRDVLDSEAELAGHGSLGARMAEQAAAAAAAARGGAGASGSGAGAGGEDDEDGGLVGAQPAAAQRGRDGSEEGGVQGAAASSAAPPAAAAAAAVPLSLDEAFAHEDATDAAMLMADLNTGGRIRRFTDARIHLQLWWPLLTGLAHIVTTDDRTEVRARALHVLFALLRRYGPGFSPALWSLVYTGVLLPIFDDVRHASEGGLPLDAAAQPRHDLENSDVPEQFALADFAASHVPQTSTRMAREVWPSPPPPVRSTQPEPLARARGGRFVHEHDWLRTTCLPALSSLIRLQTRFFKRLAHLLPALLRLIVECVDQELEGLARVGMIGLRQFLTEAACRFEAATWDGVLDTLATLFRLTQPTPLLTAGEQLLHPVEPAAEFSDEEADHDDAAARGSGGAVLPMVPSPGMIVDTPYGRGHVVRVAPNTALEAALRAAASPHADAGSSDRGVDGMVHTIVAVQLPWARAYLPTMCAPPPPAPGPAPVPAPASAPAPAPAPAPVVPFNAARVVTQCVVQLELIAAVGTVLDLHACSLQTEQVERLLTLLRDSMTFARSFNANRPLRVALLESGLMRFAKSSRAPSLLRQEVAATQQLLLHLFSMFTAAASSPAMRSVAASHLSDLVADVVQRYALLSAEAERARLSYLPAYMTAEATAGASASASAGSAEAAVAKGDVRDVFREAAAFSPLVQHLLDFLLAFDDATFAANLSWVYPVLMQLVVAGNVAVRTQVAAIFERHLRTKLGLPA